MKHSVIALKLYDGIVEVQGEKIKAKLPDGCIGLAFVFESKKAARKYWGNDIDFIRIEEIVEGGMKPTWQNEHGRIQNGRIF